MISFTKMHGLGNDYIYINRLNDKNIIADDRIPSLTRYLSSRHFGIGADGVIFIEESKIADFKMSIYNKDGSEAQMCGNGIRCFAKYVYENKLTYKKTITIETISGIKQAYLQIDREGNLTEITICMGEPILELAKLKEEGIINEIINDKINIKIEDMSFCIIPVSMGNPHAVVFVNDVEKFNVKKYGAIIEKDISFPEKTNVEFVQIIDRRYIKLRVWERGAGETLACGTGACAAFAVCVSKGYTRRNITANLPGGNLKINWNLQDNKIYMTGIATKVFDGEIE